ncbi:MAG TPA: DUF58 domain-containing protein [Solirubrobacteraceae bacterium]|nr:DUF58 domain-containing protein [Solirubrobacteraceae bacterium]
MSDRSARAQDQVVATTTERWTRSSGLAAGSVTALLLAAIGLIAGRIDIALLPLPLVAAITLGWDRRPAPDERATVTLSLTDTDSAAVNYDLAIATPPRAEMIVLRYSVLGGQAREFVVAGRVGSIAELAGVVPLLHSGPQELVRFDYRFLGVDAISASLPQEPIVGERVVPPSQTMIDALPLPRRLQAMTGSHESARLGDGGEFRDIHPFSPGDRLRRIDWKATARRGQSPGDLYVRRSNALADATVLIVMDSRDDVGEQITQWRSNVAVDKGVSSLDLAREAASSIAGAYIASGDRVGFQDLSSRARMIPHAGGGRHLWRLMKAIEVTAPSEVSFAHQRPPIVPPGALVYLLSSLLDDQPVKLALTWLGNGHRVIAVDVLPPARFARTTRYERIAHRMVLMERDDRVRVLRARGVELLRWSEDGAALPLPGRLRLLSRPTRRLGSVGAPR